MKNLYYLKRNIEYRLLEFARITNDLQEANIYTGIAGAYWPFFFVSGLAAAEIYLLWFCRFCS